MSTVIDFIILWKDLIIKVFGEYTLAASIFTIVACGIFLGLERQWRKGNTPSNLILVLIGWAVLVPIGGFILSALGKAWSVIESAVPIITTIIGSLYRIYEKHPIVVLSIVAVSLVAYLIWKWRFAKVLPRRALRISVLAVCTIVTVHIASPIADLFSSAAAINSEKTVLQQSPVTHVSPASSGVSSKEPAPVHTKIPPPVQPSPAASSMVGVGAAAR